jgi:hypothetical protein
MKAEFRHAVILGMGIAVGYAIVNFALAKVPKKLP